MKLYRPSLTNSGVQQTNGTRRNDNPHQVDYTHLQQQAQKQRKIKSTMQSDKATGNTDLNNNESTRKPDSVLQSRTTSMIEAAAHHMTAINNDQTIAINQDPATWEDHTTEDKLN